MAQQILNPEQKKQYESLRELLHACLKLTENCSDTGASKIIRDRLSHLQSAALLVIVGEVKSGKSSFVNALLGEEICEVAPDPCTTGIQELVYGEERTSKTLGDNWERLSLPKKVLREISIVDTPGTNSIIRNHQTITENYIPQSDLVIFVFSAKNPHTGSAWDFLSLVRQNWLRKMVFVLQQADLATPGELKINQERVHQYARERNVQNPRIFTVSAKLETEKGADSGFAEFREFLQNAVREGEVWRMKVEGARDTAGKISNNLLLRLQREQAAIEDDKVFYTGLLAKVKSRREKAKALRRLAVDSLCVSYDRLAYKLEQDFAEGLSVGTILRRTIPLVRDKDIKTWLKELQSDFENTSRKEIDMESSRVSKDISDELMSMFTELTEAIAHHHNTAIESFSVKDTDRVEILTRLQQQLQDLRISDITANQGIQGSGIGKLSLAGGGITALGAVIASATNMVIFDITGGILALGGLGLVAVTLIWKRSGILNDFSKKMSKSRTEFRERLDIEIARIFEKLFMEIEHRMKEPLSHLDEKSDRLVSLIEEAKRVKEMSEGLFEKSFT
jgi:GTPase SAR1 family protein